MLGADGYPADGYRSKGWGEFAAPGAPVMDFVFTVCDSAAGETCPDWPGQPMTAHWGIEDPAAVEGGDIEKERAFVTAFKYLRNRISVFISLPIRSLDKIALGAKLREIGRLDGATRVNGALARRLAAEALGTALLVATVVGSGIMAETLTKDTGLALLGNTLPTGAILVVLITILGPISGAISIRPSPSSLPSSTISGRRKRALICSRKSLAALPGPSRRI